jgi:hypothetical protein
MEAKLHSHPTKTDKRFKAIKHTLYLALTITVLQWGSYFFLFRPLWHEIVDFLEDFRDGGQKVVRTVGANGKSSVKIDDFIPAMTSTNVLAEICKQEVREPLTVFKQAMLETNNLQCGNCSLDHNNLFGFCNLDGSYIRFQNWTESITYYKQWQETKLKDGEDYYKFLIRIKYATDPDYISKLKNLKY